MLNLESSFVFVFGFTILFIFFCVACGFCSRILCIVSKKLNGPFFKFFGSGGIFLPQALGACGRLKFWLWLFF